MKNRFHWRDKKEDVTTDGQELSRRPMEVVIVHPEEQA